MLRINTNTSAFDTLRNLQGSNLSLSKSLARLSSGMRINQAADDAAGLSISDKLQAQVRGGAQAGMNVQQGISLINIADGALSQVTAMLQRMEELATESANGTLTSSDRMDVESEFSQLQQEIGDIASNTSFNGVALFSGMAGTYTTGNRTTTYGTASSGGFTLPLNGPPPPYTASALNTINVSYTFNNPGPPVTSGGGALTQGTDYTVNQTLAGYNGTTPLYDYSISLNPAVMAGGGNYTLTAVTNYTWPTSTLPLPITIQSGANSGQEQVISVPPVNASAIGVPSGTVAVDTQTNAASALKAVQQAIANVASIRGGLGAEENSLEHTYNNLQTVDESQMSANSQIRNVDMASEMTRMTRAQILTQSGMSMLSIADQEPSYLLKLLSG
ncbi:MAG TPA: flagellin, partial [Oscillatoriaceae cyanobacterium]